MLYASKEYKVVYKLYLNTKRNILPAGERNFLVNFLEV